MRKLTGGVVVIAFLLCMGGIANAIPITETVYATIKSVPYGGEPDIVIGDYVHLFDVVYDDEGTEVHSYYDDTGEIEHIWNLNNVPSYIFADDATFTLSPFITEVIQTYGGRDYHDYYIDSVTGRADGFGFGGVSIQYYTVHDDYDFVWMSPSLGTGGSYMGYLHVWSGYSNRPGLKVVFGDPSSLADPVPEPATMLLLGAGLVGLAGFRRRVKK